MVRSVENRYFYKAVARSLGVLVTSAEWMVLDVLVLLYEDTRILEIDLDRPRREPYKRGFLFQNLYLLYER